MHLIKFGHIALHCVGEEITFFLCYICYIYGNATGRAAQSHQMRVAFHSAREEPMANKDVASFMLIWTENIHFTDVQKNEYE